MNNFFSKNLENNIENNIIFVMFGGDPLVWF